MLRLLGLALLVYGAVGLAAALYGYGLVREAFASARELGVLAPGEQRRALDGLETIAATLDDASVTSNAMGTSFEQSQASLRTASAVAGDVAVAFREVARYSGVYLFGLQPLMGLSEPFQQSAQRLDDLAVDLEQTSGALGANATDMRRLADDFGRLRREVRDLRQTVGRLPTDPTNGEGARRLETALAAMLVWIGLQGLASLFAGLAILLLPLAGRRTSGGEASQPAGG